jgi:hypothetical protein
MSDDLARLPPETFLQLAVQRGGLDLDTVIQGLSPEAAAALRRIAASDLPLATPDDVTRSAPTRGIARSEPGGSARPLQLTCLACGRASQPRDRFCRNCGQRLNEPSPPVTVDDLVAQGRLTHEQAQEAKAAILFHQQHYPAGTRSSIFGGPS